MSEFFKWGKDVPWGAEYIAKYAVVCSRDTSQLIYSIMHGKNRKLVDKFMKPDGKDWLRYYRNKEKYWDELEEAFCSSDEERAAFSFIRFILRYLRYSAKKRKNAVEETNALKEIYESIDMASLRNEGEQSLRKELAEQSDDTTPDPNKLLISPAVLFLFTILMPCILQYHENPGKMLRRARNGDLNALCGLLRLDKRIQFDPGVSKMLCALIRDDPRRYKAKVVKALGTDFKFKMHPRKVKEFFSALLSQFPGSRGGITAMYMRSLFDNLKKHLSDDNSEIDNDLPESPEAFSKAVQREKKQMSRLIPTPGQK